MTASSRGSRAAASLIRSTRHPRVCSDCITRISRPSQRSYSAAAVAATESSSSSISTDGPSITVPPVTSSSSAPDFSVHSGLLLSRPPLLTKPPTPFEESFYFYQKRLNERLVMPFTRYFYFKKDTPGLADWKIKARERDWQPARELGGYNPYRDEAWNDELLVGDKLSGTTAMVDKLVTEAIPRAVEGKDGLMHEVKLGEEGAGGTEAQAVVKPEARITEADRSNDQTRLDRKLNRTLYLCVKRAKGGWGLPSGAIEGRENLHDAAERILSQTAGVNMNTWIVGHAPAGHHVLHPTYKDNKLERPGIRTFFMRARIMAGQANLKGNLFGLSEYKWLTKQEAEKHFGPRYFSAIKNMLHDR